METRVFTIEKDASPLCLVGRLEGHSPGVFLPESTMVLLRQLLGERRALNREKLPGSNAPGTSLEDLVSELLAAHAGAVTWTENVDLQAALRELRAMAEKLNGGDDDGPGRA
jgi:hypothetical protein